MRTYENVAIEELDENGEPVKRYSNPYELCAEIGKDKASGICQRIMYGYRLYGKRYRFAGDRYLETTSNKDGG